ncbi:aminopeptidase P family protein [Bacillaceae bacterium Marseille-Q3522]|nr:aminopeptidase P family protein [Bacillaceae bacterium Marseille-Q3522]
MDKTTKLSQWMKENEIDVTLLTSTDNVFYMSGYYSDPHERLLGAVFFQEAEPVFICPGMEKEDAKKSGWPYEIIGYDDTENPWELLHTAIKKRLPSIHKVAIEKQHLNVERFEIVLQLFADAVFVPAEEKLQQLRLIKNAEELDKIREACALADFAVEVGCNELKEGKTELEVLAAIEYEMKKKGILRMSFSTMVLTGANGASPHGNPGNSKIKKGDLVLFDLGVVVDGYCSDITRTVAFGDIDDIQARIYNTVLKAQLAALQAAKPGVSCSEIDLTARNIITDEGYGDDFPHRLGHGLGIGIHEYPSMTATNPLLLQEGMVFTVEPGIYVPEIAGVRIEDDVVVTKTGIEILTKFPKELQIINN